MVVVQMYRSHDDARTGKHVHVDAHDMDTYVASPMMKLYSRKRLAMYDTLSSV